MTDILNKTLNTGISNIFAMASGTIFLENIKMEKQRTNDLYKNIIKKFYKNGISGYLSGFYPYGALSGFLKGCSIGLSSNLIDKNLKMDNIYYKKIITGIGTGITESLVMNPLMMSRNLSNKILIENVNRINLRQQQSLVLEYYKKFLKNHGITYFYKGLPTLIMKRSVDWAARFYFIEKVENMYKKYINSKYTLKDKIICTFAGAMLTMPITTPFDRFIPVIYESGYKRAVEIIKRDGFRSLYTCGSVRVINIGLYTTYIMCFPQIVQLK
jgi:hypothetical protein